MGTPDVPAGLPAVPVSARPAPVADRLELWFLDLDSAVLPDGGRCLDEAERAHASRLRRPLDPARYRASHCLLRHLLGAYLGRAAGELRFSRSCRHCSDTSHGKPRVSGIEFSLSHSGGWAAVAVAAAGVTVGVDLEENRPGVEWSSILGYLSDSGVDDGDGFAAWTRLEAVVKAAGLGVVARASVAAAEADGWHPARVTGANGAWWVRSVPAPGGYHAAVAADQRLPLVIRTDDVPAAPS